MARVANVGAVRLQLLQVQLGSRAFVQSVAESHEEAVNRMDPVPLECPPSLTHK